MQPHIEIAGRRIGAAEPAYVIAELSANHGQQFDRAARLIEAAKEAGADAIKLQTYTPDTMTLASDAEHFTVSGTIWHGRRLYDLYAEASTPWEWHGRLKEMAERAGLHCFSTPFDDSAVAFLESLAVPAYKIASFELVDLGLIRRAARTGKPMIMSTGMASFAEIEEAVAAARAAGAEAVALLKCTSAYPAPPSEMHLRTIPHLASSFAVPVGLSDHTLGVTVAVTAVSLGACIIEKHLTLSRSDPGPDSAFSLEPAEFTAMVDAVRTAQAALGEVHYGTTEREAATRAFRRSLFVVEPMRAGDLFSAENVRSIRPGAGLHPRHFDEVIGQRAARDIARGTPLAWDLIAGTSQ